MIFKLLIVDDEATMRKGLANFMNWTSIDCEVVGTASDGIEAIHFLSEHPVDIVITDIKMPEADGLDVAKFIYENHPEIKVILLTGYADFAYAQTAIRYNVSRFLLKPTNKKTLFEAVAETQKELLASRQKSSIAKEELAFLKEQVLQELTNQPLTPQLQSRLEKFGLSLDYYCISAFQMIPAGDDTTFLKNIIINGKKNAYCYRYNNLIVTVHFLDKQMSVPPNEIITNLQELISITESFDTRHAAVGLSRCHQGSKEFGTAVSEAISALSMNFYSETNLALFTEAVRDGNCDLTAENSMDLFHFENSLLNRDFQDTANILSNIFMKFKSNFIPSADAINLCSQIYYICSRVLMKKGLSSTEESFLSDIHGSIDIFSLEKSTMAFVRHTRECLTGSTGTSGKLIESAIFYIHSHLTEPLSLEIIAEQLHISPSHLSRTFKKAQDESLTEYINKARIKKAQEYLSDSEILTYEVAELVGYNDPTYFSSIFKKYTGESPTDYRQHLRKSLM